MNIAERFPLLLGLAICFWPGSAPGQTPAPVGRISGGEFRVRGQVEFAPDGAALLLSGAEVDVRAGIARLALPGGEARFCGPVKITVLRSSAERPPGSSGQVPPPVPTLFAMDSGALELDYSGSAPDTVQTPFFSVVAVPAAQAAARKLAVRVGSTGDACVAAMAGSLRVREQLGASELLIPPGKAMLIPATGVEKAAPVALGACSCGAQAPVMDAAESPSAPSPASVSEPKTAVETKTTIAPAPLVYQADPRQAEAVSNSPPKGDPAAAGTKELVVTLPVVVATATGSAPAAAARAEQAPAAPPSAKRRSSFGARLKSFFRALFGGSR